MKTKSGLEDKRLLESLEFIDETYISETMEHYKDVPDVSGKPQVDNRAVRRTLRQSLVLAACLVLLSAAIPLATNMLRNQMNVSGPADGVGGDQSDMIETEPPESLEEIEEITARLELIYDGSEGLEYVMNPDGKSASFIGFGTCTDEEIVIASTYNDVPVTQMRNEAYLNGVQYCGSNYAKSITVSDTVEEIDNGVFEYCPYLESIYIGANVSYMRPFVANSWEGHYLAEIKVAPENIYFSDNGNCLIEKQSKTLIVACKNSVIPDDGSVEIIGDRAFYGLKPVNPIVIPDCIKRIEYQAFAGCNVFESIVLPESLEYMGIGAFELCPSLKSIDLNGFTEIPEYAFSGASALSEIKGLEYVTEIGRSAFNACNCLTRVDFGTALKKIGIHAFAGTPWVATVYYSGTVEQWNAVEKDSEWFVYPIEYPESPLREIICSDGVAEP